MCSVQCTKTKAMVESKAEHQAGADSPSDFLSDVDERELARVGKKSVLKVSLESYIHQRGSV